LSNTQEKVLSNILAPVLADNDGKLRRQRICGVKTMAVQDTKNRKGHYGLPAFRGRTCDRRSGMTPDAFADD